MKYNSGSFELNSPNGDGDDKGKWEKTKAESGEDHFGPTMFGENQKGLEKDESTGKAWDDDGDAPENEGLTIVPDSEIEEDSGGETSEDTEHEARIKAWAEAEGIDPKEAGLT